MNTYCPNWSNEKNLITKNINLGLLVIVVFSRHLSFISEIMQDNIEKSGYHRDVRVTTPDELFSQALHQNFLYVRLKQRRIE